MDSSIKSPPGIWPNHESLWLDTDFVSLPRGKPVVKSVFIRARRGDSVYIYAPNKRIPISSPQSYWSGEEGRLSAKTNEFGLIELKIGPTNSKTGCNILVNHNLQKIKYIYVSVYDTQE